MLRALLLAPPGAGKGTQGERIAKAYDVVHVATGDVLRENVRAGTPIGREASRFMDRGELVPDPIVVELVTQRIAGPEPLPGFVLDGFPRTLTQAEAAFAWAKQQDRTFHAVISLDVPREELVRRILERGRLAGRSDDTPETVERRLELYDQNVQPLLDFYESRGILIPIDGTGSEGDVYARIGAELDHLDLSR